MEFAKLNNAASVRMAVGFGVIRLRKRFSALDLRALSFSHWVCMWYQIKNNNQIQNKMTLKMSSCLVTREHTRKCVNHPMA